MSTRESCISEAHLRRSVVWLQCITVAWMFAEAGISLYGSLKARSPALLAFGADSGVELLSATVVLLAAILPGHFSESRASLWAGYLLFMLAGVVAVTSVLSITRGISPVTSYVGIGITVAALLVMPLLAWLKRRTARARTIGRWLPTRFNRQRVLTSPL